MNSSRLKTFRLLMLLSFLGIFDSIVVAQTIDTFEVYSQSMKKSIKNLVIKPDQYFTNQDSFPTVYLLHGATGGYKQWLNDAPNLQALATKYEVVIVTPDGGYTSWYFDSPVDSTYKYATYLAEELISSVENNYRVVQHSSRRAITGLSMGGHGAFYLASLYKEKWTAAGSICGGLDFRPFPNSWDLKLRLGEKVNKPENWEKYTVINRLDQFKDNPTKLIFDCGIDDFFYDGNVATHQLMIEMKIQHEFTVRPGKHNKAYWSNALEYHLLFFQKAFGL
jgi:S-formylglutathione hydrolase FrmB